MDSSEKSSSRKGDKIDTRGTGNFSDSKSDKKQTENPAQVPLETPVSTVGADSQTDQDGKNEVAGKTIFSGSQSFLLKHGATFASRKGAESQTVSPEQQHDTIAKEIHVYDNELGDHAPKPRTPGEPPDQAGGACLQTDFHEKKQNEAMTSLEIQKRQILKDEIRRLEEQPEKMNSTLASLNLPAALEDFSDRQEVPQSLIDIAQKIKNMGGIKFLSKQMTDLTELLQKNKDILNECIEMIDDEEKSDQGLQEKFKDKWTRTSSDKLNQQFREENMKLLQTVEAAYDTYNSVLLKKYEKHSKIIELLSKSTNVNTEFCQWKGSDQSVTQSMSLLKDLAGGLEKFMELKACLEKATKSYTDVTIQIKSHREHISAFCDERNLDKVELMANIQKSIASQPTGPIPSTPNYHNPAASTPSQEPEPSSSDTQTASSNSPDTWIGHFSHSSDDGAQKTQPGPSTHFSGFPGPPSGGESCTREYPSVQVTDKSSLSTVLKDRKVVNITIPTSFMEKGKHSAHESFNDAYTKILKFKIRSVLMPMKIDGNWSTKKLVKALVYPLTKLGSEEAITVILFSSDPNQCETANLVIQDANRKGNSMDQVSTNQPKRIEFLVEKIGITKAKVDVIVNTVHTSLNLQHGYVSKAILDAASDSQNLQDELTRKKGNKTDVEHGELFETNSYGLNCKKIFHGALKPWTAKTSKNIMQKFIIACLEKADEHKFSVLAFPAIGTGNLGFPEKAVLEIVKETVRKFENDHPNTSIRKIVFCIHANDEKKFKTFQDFFKDVDDEIESKHTLSDFTRGSGLEEIVLLGVERDVRNVVQTLNHELQRKCLESFCKQLPIEPNLEEPETQTISNRNGEESTNGKKGSTLSTEQDQDTNPKNISKIDALKEDDDTKRCKIARFTDRKELDGNPIFQRIKPRAVICPYKNDNEALVIFEKRKDAEEFSKNPFPLKVEDLEEQAVRNLEAQISDKYLSCIDDHHDLEDNLIKSSGVWIEKNGKKWILSGNLPQIELAYEFLQHRILSQKENNQGNAHGSATNLDSNAEKFIKKYIPMTANEYARFMGLIKMSDARIIENISYDTPMNCLYVCGSKSYVEHIEKLTKGVIFRVIEVTDDVFKQMKADIVDLAKTNSVLHYYETDGKLELFGMSHKAVDSAVMLLETKIADLLNPSKMKRSRNQPNLGRVQTSQSAVPFMRCTELGQKEYFLKFNFKVLLYEDDILESKVDAICCGQDPSFQSKGHIAGAIVKAHKNVGEQLKQEKVKKKEYGIGEYIPIKCNLQKGKHVLVIFVVTKSPASAKKATKKTLEGIKRCFENVLNFAEWNRIKSLALPLLGTGNKGAPINDIARIWFDSLLEFIENRRETSNLKEVHFVNKDSACLKAVQGQLEAYVAKAETALY
uniref:Uncharacterized protein LOC111135768 isoform X8 n=1 Tax=Crassostrea virginica TaxID=6565 RepID=A0A8B8EPF4_CRAVI|nr:uncharacterized protein LOC111135768 isoform X8 [Crassostrea virginica]